MATVERVFPEGHRAQQMALEALRAAFPEWKGIQSLKLFFVQLAIWVHSVRVKFTQTLQWLEFFAGEAQLTLHMLKAGLKCKAFELLMQPHSEKHALSLASCF